MNFFTDKLTLKVSDINNNNILSVSEYLKGDERLQKGEDFIKNLAVFLKKVFFFIGYKWHSSLSDVFSSEYENNRENLKKEETYILVKNFMFFLNKNKLKRFSLLLFLAICKEMKISNKVREIVKDLNFLEYSMNLFKYKKVKNKSCHFTGLTYKGNSCYQDSLFLSLFSMENRFISKNILNNDFANDKGELDCDLQTKKKIRDELVNITKSMRSKKTGKTCSDLRNILKKCLSSSKQLFYKEIPQDVGEFLQYIFSIFSVEGVLISEKTFFTNDLDTEEPVEKKLVSNKVYSSSPIIVVSVFKLLENEILHLSDMLKTTENHILDKKNRAKDSEGNLYSRKIEKIQIKKAEFLVFYVQRLLGDERLFTKVFPESQIEVGAKTLFLYSIIVHKGGHYTCFIKCVNSWFFYDDTKKNISFVGDYKDMLENDRLDPTSLGVLYFYK